MNPNLAFLNTFANVSEDTFLKLQNISRYKTLKKQEFIIKEGEFADGIYMLISGVMRAYIDSESGKQYNKKIFAPISFVGALTALIKDKPSELTYQALTDCKAYKIDYKALIQLCKTDLSISSLYIKILEHVFMQYERRSLELMSLNATERYIKLKQQIPMIDDLIPQFQIASYLNVTSVQLSRIRKQLNL